jgi:integrase/recombinase XerD
MSQLYSAQPQVMVSMMRVEKFWHPKHERMAFRVYLNDLPFSPINKFLSHLDKREFAPNTVRAYSHDLVLYFRYLKTIKSDWVDADIDTVIGFISHLKHSSTSSLSIIPTEDQQARTLSTINRCLAAVSAFYRFCTQAGLIENLSRYDALIGNEAGRNFKIKEFLSFARDSRPYSVSRNLKPFRRKKSLKKNVQILSEQEKEGLLTFCSNNRDRLLVLLLIETGMRIGQALQLRHSDIASWDSKLTIQARNNNPHEVYPKTQVPYDVVLTDAWLKLYTDFIVYSIDDVESDYVFTKLYRKDGGNKGEPLSYASVKDFFRRYSSVAGRVISPHMLRHTHATELLRAGVSIEIVSKRLGHRSIETTKQIYEHLNNKDMKLALGIGATNEND